jgi:DNA-binding response OmpR family regulator
VVDGLPASRDAAMDGSPLVVALAPEASAGDHVRTLARDADLVLSLGVHGRILLATILALLRWRSQ